MEDMMELPEGVVEELRKLVDAVPDGEVLQYAEDHPEIRAGFTISPRGLPMFRLRIKQKIRPSTRIETLPRDLLNSYDLGWPFLVVLSGKAVERNIGAFLGYFGRDRFLANMLLDDRAFVRGHALEHISDRYGAMEELPDRDEAAQYLGDELKSFFAHIGPIFDTSPCAPADSADGPERSKELKRKISDLEQRAGRHLKDEEKLRKTIELIRHDLLRAKEDLLGKNKLCSELNSKLTQKEEEIGILRAGEENRIKDEVRRKMESELYRWLRDAKEMEAEAGRATSSRTLLERVEKVLQQQAVFDRKYGSRVKLAGTLREHEEALGRIREAQSESLVPVRELSGLAEALESEISRISDRLGKDHHKGPLIEKARAAINLISCRNDLERAYDLINELDRFGLVEAEGLRTCEKITGGKNNLMT